MRIRTRKIIREYVAEWAGCTESAIISAVVAGGGDAEHATKVLGRMSAAGKQIVKNGDGYNKAP